MTLPRSIAATTHASKHCSIETRRYRSGIVRFQQAKIDGATWFGRDGLALENPNMSNSSA
jgi:hypothetical protein